MGSSRSIEVLTGGFGTPNGRGFLTPIYRARRELNDAGWTVRFRSSSSDMSGADLALVDSKYYARRWRTDKEAVVAELQVLKDRHGLLVWHDCTDSSTTVIPPALEVVDRYLKSFLLVDRSQYLKPLGANRYHLDWYMKLGMIAEEAADPFFLVSNRTHLEKLRVGWNPGLAYYGPGWPLAQWLEARIKRPVYYERGIRVPEVSADRRGISCRIGFGHDVQGVAEYRRLLVGHLAARLTVGKLGNLAYQRELASTRVGISPFGLGEFALRDFEMLRAGMVLLKPDLSHMETFPELYEAGKTYVPFSWDFQDLNDQIEWGLNSPDALEIARAGQSRYLHWAASKDARRDFVNHVLQAIK